MENNNLRRQLSPMHVWAIAFGCVIGWGSFINPGKKFLPNSGVAGTAIAMILGALVMIVIAFSYAYMVPKYPSAGGEFSFAKNCFGKRMAFLCGWFLVVAYLTNVPMNSTAIGLIVDGLDGTAFLKGMAWIGVVFSLTFMVLQLIPIPGLSGVHFGRESYIMLVIWVLIGLVFYYKQRKWFNS